MHRFKIRDRVKIKIDIGRNKYTGFTGTYAGAHGGAFNAAAENPFVWVKLDGVPGNTVFRLKELEPHQDIKPHKHAELIKAWADNPSLVLQYRFGNNDWMNAPAPSWNPKYEYRIKPEPKPDVVVLGMLELEGDGDLSVCVDGFGRWDNINIKAVFDGETKRLKDVCIYNRDSEK